MKRNAERTGKAVASERYRTLPNATERYQLEANATERSQTKDKEEIKGKIELPVGSSKKETTTTRFAAPTLEEVRAYCLERKNGIDAAHFVDYYTANGWKVGKQNMKDWKAAVRTWEHNERKLNPENSGDKYTVGDDYIGL